MINKNYLKISGIYYLATILVCVWFVLGYLGRIRTDILSSVLIQLISMLIIPLALYTFIISKSAKQTIKDVGIKKVSSKTVGLCVLLGIVLYFFNSYVANFFSTILGILGWENLYAKFSTTTIRFSYGLLVKEFILTAIFPAICEEVLHRGLLLHAGKKFASTKICLIVSSILFGLMHQNIQQFFYASILGFIMGYVSLVTNSIIPSMILHFMNNALSTYFYYGSLLGWRIPILYNKIHTFISSKGLLNVIISCICLFVIIYLIINLIRELKVEHTKLEISKLVQNINITALPVSEIQAKVDEINAVIQNKNRIFAPHKKLGFKNNIFIISSFVLSGFVTICSLIWGLI